jgi:hypothetical protein
MITRFDKAIVAFVLGALSIVNWVFGTHWAIGEEGIGIVLAVLMPILVWLFPNKHDATSR